jgi:hypothetical protein
LGGKVQVIADAGLSDVEHPKILQKRMADAKQQGHEFCVAFPGEPQVGNIVSHLFDGEEETGGDVAG